MSQRTWFGAVLELILAAVIIVGVGVGCVMLPEVHSDWIKAPIGDNPDVPSGRSLDWWAKKPTPEAVPEIEPISMADWTPLIAADGKN